MPLANSVPEQSATEKTAQAYERIREALGYAQVPPAFTSLGAVPALLQDTYMNYKKFVATEGKIDKPTRLLLALTVSAVQRCDIWTDFLSDEATKAGNSAETIADAVAVASACVMYNVFFKFRDIAGSDVFGGMPVGLRAHTFNSTSLPDQTVELINIVISDINGCKPCTSGHVEKARKLGISDEAILEAVQVAATVIAPVTYINATGVQPPA